MRALIESGTIDRRFVRAVLAIDFTNPVFSSVRAKLLTLLPEQETPHWKDEFIVRLRASQLPGAQELAENLVQGDRNEEYYADRFRRYVGNLRRRALTEDGLEDYFRLLLQRRKEIAASEISANPRGSILEPGFRVIFPESPHATSPGELSLSAEGYLMQGNKCASRLR